MARYAEAPTAEHLASGNTVRRYVKGTVYYSLSYGEAGELIDYSHADYAGDLGTHRSTSGYIFTYIGGAIIWASNLQRTVAASTTEAEYVVAAPAEKEAFWLQRLLGALAGRGGGVPLRCDNQVAMAMVQNNAKSQQTKQIDVTYRFLCENVTNKTLRSFTPTTARAAEVLTKPLPRASFEAVVAAMALKTSD